MARVTAITKLVAQPGRFDDLVRAANDMVAAVEGEEGTEVYAVSRATNASDTLFVVEVFTDQAASEAHAAAGKAIGQLLKPLVAKVEIVLGEPLVAKGQPG